MNKNIPETLEDYVRMEEFDMLGNEYRGKMSNEINESHMSQRQEYLDDLYEIARSRNDPLLLESLESFLAATVEGLLQKQSDNEKLDTALKHATEKNSAIALELEAEMEHQVAMLEEKIRTEEKRKLNEQKQEANQQLNRAQCELKEMENKVKELEDQIEIKKNEANIPEVIIEEIQYKEKENQMLQGRLLELQTQMALMRTEVAEMKGVYDEQVSRLASERGAILSCVGEQENLTRQLQLLHEANKRLHDTNDDLRSALSCKRNSLIADENCQFQRSASFMLPKTIQNSPFLCTSFRSDPGAHHSKTGSLISNNGGDTDDDSKQSMPYDDEEDIFRTPVKDNEAIKRSKVNQTPLLAELMAADESFVHDTPVFGDPYKRYSVQYSPANSTMMESPVSMSDRESFVKQLEILCNTNRRLGESNDELRDALMLLSQKLRSEDNMKMMECRSAPVTPYKLKYPNEERPKSTSSPRKVLLTKSGYQPLCESRSMPDISRDLGEAADKLSRIDVSSPPKSPDATAQPNNIDSAITSQLLPGEVSNAVTTVQSNSTVVTTIETDSTNVLKVSPPICSDLLDRGSSSGSSTGMNSSENNNLLLNEIYLDNTADVKNPSSNHVYSRKPEQYGGYPSKSDESQSCKMYASNCSDTQNSSTPNGSSKSDGLQRSTSKNTYAIKSPDNQNYCSRKCSNRSDDSESSLCNKRKNMKCKTKISSNRYNSIKSDDSQTSSYNEKYQRKSPETQNYSNQNYSSRSDDSESSLCNKRKNMKCKTKISSYRNNSIKSDDSQTSSYNEIYQRKSPETQNSSNENHSNRSDESESSLSKKTYVVKSKIKKSSKRKHSIKSDVSHSSSNKAYARLSPDIQNYSSGNCSIKSDDPQTFLSNEKHQMKSPDTQNSSNQFYSNKSDDSEGSLSNKTYSLKSKAQNSSNRKHSIKSNDSCTSISNKAYTRKSPDIQNSSSRNYSSKSDDSQSSLYNRKHQRRSHDSQNSSHQIYSSNSDDSQRSSYNNLFLKKLPVTENVSNKASSQSVDSRGSSSDKSSSVKSPDLQRFSNQNYLSKSDDSEYSPYNKIYFRKLCNTYHSSNKRNSTLSDDSQTSSSSNKPYSIISPHTYSSSPQSGFSKSGDSQCSSKKSDNQCLIKQRCSKGSQNLPSNQAFPIKYHTGQASSSESVSGKPNDNRNLSSMQRHSSGPSSKCCPRSCSQIPDIPAASLVPSATPQTTKVVIPPIPVNPAIDCRDHREKTLNVCSDMSTDKVICECGKDVYDSDISICDECIDRITGVVDGSSFDDTSSYDEGTIYGKDTSSLVHLTKEIKIVSPEAMVVTTDNSKLDKSIQCSESDFCESQITELNDLADKYLPHDCKNFNCYCLEEDTEYALEKSTQVSEFHLHKLCKDAMCPKELEMVQQSEFMPPNICSICHNEIMINKRGVDVCLCNNNYNDINQFSFKQLLAETTVLTDSDSSNNYSDQESSPPELHKRLRPAGSESNQDATYETSDRHTVHDKSTLMSDASILQRDVQTFKAEVDAYSPVQPNEFVGDDDMEDEELVRLVDQTNEEDLSVSLSEEPIYIERKIIEPMAARGIAAGADTPDDTASSGRATPDRTYKLVLAGDAAVGKSSFIIRLCKNKFYSALNSTLGVDFQMKTLSVDGKRIALQLWDTAGQERFRSIAKSYFRRVDGVILLYDVTCENSFMDVRDWLESIESSSSKEIPIIICGNKTDLRNEYSERGMPVVSKEQGEKMAGEVGALFIETSAKDGININKACMELARKLEAANIEEDANETIDLEKEKTKKKSSCCS